MEKYKEYIGFHGTTTENAEKILAEKKFNQSKKLDEWLGKGIYFFAYPEDAEWWCKEYKKLIQPNEYTILQVEIVVESVLDLLGSKENIERFKRFCDLVKRKSPTLPDGRLRSNYMSLAIAVMMKNQNYRKDMLIGGFEQNRKMWYKKESQERNKFPIMIAQIQYCVQYNSCIKNIVKYEKGDT